MAFNLPNGPLNMRKTTQGKGRTFRKVKLRRKRIECIEIATGNIYLFSALTEVEIV